MWDIDSIWFEIAIVSAIITLGQIFLGHFEERTPRLKKLVKYVLFLGVTIGLSYFFGRWVALLFLGLFMIPVLYVHLIYLPKKGINGWTGEPKKKYYELRGWDTNLFSEGRQTDPDAS